MLTKPYTLKKKIQRKRFYKDGISETDVLRKETDTYRLTIQNTDKKTRQHTVNSLEIGESNQAMNNFERE